MDEADPPDNQKRSSIGFIMAMFIGLPLGTLVLFFLVQLMNYSLEPTICRMDLMQMNSIKVALIQYKHLCGRLPSTEQGLAVLIGSLGPDDAKRKERQLLQTGDIIDPWGNPYQYRNPSLTQGRVFDLWGMGPDGVNGTEDDVHPD